VQDRDELQVAEQRSPMDHLPAAANADVSRSTVALTYKSYKAKLSHQAASNVT
jgi:hypothetical protein